MGSVSWSRAPPISGGRAGDDRQSSESETMSGKCKGVGGQGNGEPNSDWFSLYITQFFAFESAARYGYLL